jgi:uncharacterized protein (DUF1778 family)
MTGPRDKAEGHWRKKVGGLTLSSSLPAALETLDDRRAFQLDDAQWTAFMKALDTPPEENPHLRRLLETKARWELGGRGE